MKLKLKSAEEFRRLLTALLDDLVDARFHFTLHQNLSKAGEEYAIEIAQSPTFWGLTLSAHMDAVLLRLCRAYDAYEHTALNLRNLLDTVRANLSIFDEPNFRQRLKGNLFVDSLAAELKSPDHTQLQKDIEVVSDSDPLVRKLVMWRHNYVAHRNSHFTLNPKKFDAQYPLLFAEIDVLLERALEIGNRYSLLFDASSHATLMMGRDDYLSVLKAVREHVEAYKRRLEEEWKRVGAAANSDVL
jgi:HEPN superfamily AbiU2-like protein